MDEKMALFSVFCFKVAEWTVHHVGRLVNALPVNVAASVGHVGVAVYIVSVGVEYRAQYYINT